ncbi:MAG: hypothetical protein U9R68_00485 [Planctomycetota bacterium]|nr:hypothetical protein [Planctomycetota bacterium]
MLLCLLPATAAASEDPFRPSEYWLSSAVQRADAVVRARAVGTENWPVARRAGGRTAEPVPVTLFEVKRYLAGQCPSPVRVHLPTGDDAVALPPAVGEVCLLCLRPAPWWPGLWREVYDGATVLPVVDGRVRPPANLQMSDEWQRRFPDRSLTAWEDGLIWARGPCMEVEPPADAFPCDGPVTLRITFTNPGRLPMTLPLGPGPEAAGRFVLELFDWHGHRVVRDWRCRRAGERDRSGERPRHEKVTLRPDESVTRTLRMLPATAAFRQDPRRVRAARLVFKEGFGGGDWGGEAATRFPIRFRCRFDRWARDLQAPSRCWAVTMKYDWSGTRLRRTVGSARDLRLSVHLFRPARPRYTTVWREALTPGEQRALAACFRIERGGKVLPGPSPEPEVVRAILARLDPARAHWALEPVNLAEFFDLSVPGDYRVRAVLPGPAGPTRSHVVDVRIVAGEGADLKGPGVGRTAAPSPLTGEGRGEGERVEAAVGTHASP